MARLFIATLAFLVLITGTAAICYTPNGTDRNAMFNVPDGYDYAPCDNTAEFSMCCAIGPGRDGTQDTCLQSGLCQNGADTWRESCTDKSWKSPACIKLFVNGTGLYDSTPGDDGQFISDVTVTPCDDGSWCDGSDNRACCEQGEGFFILNGKQTKQNPTATTSKSGSTAAPTASKSAAPTSSSSSGLSSGAKAGIGVGVAAGVLLILAIIILSARHMKKSRAAHRSPRDVARYPAPVPAWQTKAAYKPPVELLTPPAEMESPAPRYREVQSSPPVELQ